MGVRLGGRQKGTPNKTTASVKAALGKAFDGLGGIPALIAWGKSEPAEFYKLWVKLMPTQVQHTGEGGGPIKAEVAFDFSKVPAPELTEYESVLAKLRERMAPPVGSPPSGEVPAQAK